MATSEREWHYLDHEGKSQGPVSLGDLHALYEQGSIGNYTHVANIRMPRRLGPGGAEMFSTSVPYSMIATLSVEFEPSIPELFAKRQGRPTTILSGPNNCGKSLVLKQLMFAFEQRAYYVGVNRFYSLDVLNTRARDINEKRNNYESFVQQQFTSSQNIDQNGRGLDAVLVGLSNDQRKKLFDLAGTLLSCTFSMKRQDEDNELSPFYVDVDNSNLKYSSSGTRLLLVLLGNMFDPDYSVLLIDEPELGLSPKIQAALSRAMYDSDLRQRYLPHLKQVFVVTHSHLFLDRTDVSNNYLVEKKGDKVRLTQVSSVQDLHRLQFEMLGNDLEALFLPSAIVVVEGDSDVEFLSKLFRLRAPAHRVAVVPSHGDGESKDKVNTLTEALGDLRTSPYRRRLFVLLDQKNSVKRSRLEGQGVLSSHITIWDKNGIEYYYPRDLVAKCFLCGVEAVAAADLSIDPIRIGGEDRRKKQLSSFVSAELTVNHELAPQLEAFVRDVIASVAT